MTGRRKPAKRGPVQAAIAPHPFQPYPASVYPPDFKDRLVCRTCQAVGVAGDQRHPLPETVIAPPPQVPAAVAAARAQYDAAILGEAGDD